MLKNTLMFCALVLIGLNAAAVAYILVDIPIVYKKPSGECLGIQYHDGLVPYCDTLPDKYETVYIASMQYIPAYSVNK